MGKKIRVFIVEDALFLKEALCRVLQEAGCEISGTAEGGGEQTLLEIQKSCPDLVLMDLALPGQSGACLTRALGRICPQIQVIICSGLLKTQEALYKSETAGALHFVHKPFGFTEIVDKIYSVMEDQQQLMAA